MLHMTPSILKNFFSKSATRLYPVDVREPFELSRGALEIRLEDCIFCGTCMRKCPSKCITVDKKGFWDMDPFACVYCGICVDNCPTSCLYQSRDYRPPEEEKFHVSLQGEPPKKKGKVKLQGPEDGAGGPGEEEAAGSESEDVGKE
ncbi:MAG: 4Fe-4S binding protein [Desulfonatronovibrionaceae bacterium]